MEKLRKIIETANRGNAATKATIAIVLVCGAILTVKAAGVMVRQLQAKEQIASSLKASAGSSNALAQYKKDAAEQIAKVTRNHLFAGEPQKPSPPQFAGVMGDEVLFNGQWYRVGAEISGAKILSIEPTLITVQFGEQQLNLVPEPRVDPNARMAGGPPQRSGPGGDARRGGESGQGPGPSRGGRSGRGGFGGFMNMSQEERESMRERFMNMSPDERRAYFQQMRDGAMRSQ